MSDVVHIKTPSGVLGNATIDWLEGQLIKWNKGEKKVEVDVSQSSFAKEFSVELARLLVLYNFKFIGLSLERELYIDSVIQTGYFIKESKGPSGYFAWIKSKIEETDYPFMVLDNTLADKEPKLNIVQPLYFENNVLRYRKLLPKYVEPVELEKGLQDKETIWVTDTVHKLDLVDANFGLRFACNDKERAILDILSNIISRRLVGFI